MHERNANPTRGAQCAVAQYTIPRRRICAAAHRGSCVNVVRTLTVFFSVFASFSHNASTVVASLDSTNVFRDRLGDHCREFGVKQCSNGALTSPLVLLHITDV